METKFKITGNWNELKIKLRKKYPNLTEGDVAYTSGKEDELLAKLQQKLGVTREEAVDMIEDLQSEATEKETTEKESREKEPTEKEPSKKY